MNLNFQPCTNMIAILLSSECSNARRLSHACELRFKCISMHSTLWGDVGFFKCSVVLFGSSVETATCGEDGDFSCQPVLFLITFSHPQAKGTINSSPLTNFSFLAESWTCEPRSTFILYVSVSIRGLRFHSFRLRASTFNKLERFHFPSVSHIVMLLFILSFD